MNGWRSERSERSQHDAVDCLQRVDDPSKTWDRARTVNNLGEGSVLVRIQTAGATLYHVPTCLVPEVGPLSRVRVRRNTLTNPHNVTKISFTGHFNFDYFRSRVIMCA